jgi:hypothetical protein
VFRARIIIRPRACPVAETPGANEVDDRKAVDDALPNGVERDSPEPASSAAGANGARQKDDPPQSLASLIGTIDPEEIPELSRAQELIPAYELLHGLAGRGELEFVVRTAALEALIASGHAFFSQHEVNETLYWLDDDGKDRIVRALRDSGWLEYRPGAGDMITNAGRSVFEVLQLLRGKLESGELLPTVASLEHAISVGKDPLGVLDTLRLLLAVDYAEIEDALGTHSEVVLRATAGKIDEALSHSSRINALLDRIPRNTPRAWRSIREIHDQLSRLHGRVAELHGAITEVGRQYLRLTAGLTTQQIVAALIRKPKDLLAEVGREALLPALAPPALLTTEALAYRALAHFSRERIRAEQVRWEEPPEMTLKSSGQEQIPPEVVAFLVELAAISTDGRTASFSQVIPHDNKTESFLRASLLPLARERRYAEGVVGRFSALALEVHAEGDGWPTDLADSVLAALTAGTVRSSSPEKAGAKKK